MAGQNSHAEDGEEVREERLLTYEQASQLLMVPKGTLYSWVHCRRIPHIRLGPRLVKFRPSDLTQWVEAHRVEVGAK